MYFKERRQENVDLVIKLDEEELEENEELRPRYSELQIKTNYLHSLKKEATHSLVLTDRGRRA